MSRAPMGNRTRRASARAHVLEELPRHGAEPAWHLAARELRRRPPAAAAPAGASQAHRGAALQGERSPSSSARGGVRAHAPSSPRPRRCVGYRDDGCTTARTARMMRGGSCCPGRAASGRSRAKPRRKGGRNRRRRRRCDSSSAAAAAALRAERAAAGVARAPGPQRRAPKVITLR